MLKYSGFQDVSGPAKPFEKRGVPCELYESSADEVSDEEDERFNSEYRSQ